MLGRPPAIWWMGPAVPVGVTGTRSSVPLLKLLTHRAPLWNLSPLAPIGRASVITGARAASGSPRGRDPAEGGTGHPPGRPPARDRNRPDGALEAVRDVEGASGRVDGQAVGARVGGQG